MTGERAVMLVLKVTYFREFSYLNSSCIRIKYYRLRLWVLRETNSRFCSKTQWQMFLLVSGRHVGVHLGGHQHGGSIQISINLGKTFLLISSVRKIAVTWILARGFAYLYLPYFNRFWTLSIEQFWFLFDLFWKADAENQQLLYFRHSTLWIISFYLVFRKN